MNSLLEIRNLHIQFTDGRRIIRAVNGVDLELRDGELLALVGESGSGKTLTALSITKLLPQEAKITQGCVFFNGRDLLKSDESHLEQIRGKEISYIFQEPQASLNPVLTIGGQIQEAVILHQGKNKEKALKESFDLLKLVRLPQTHNILRSYPHQLSGGMNQRVMLAMALSSHPKLLIADEPTTALDVTIEDEIIKMLLELRRNLGFSILFITHNLALAKEFADRIAIMFEGKIVESGTVSDIFLHPAHQHTKDLLDSIIRL